MAELTRITKEQLQKLYDENLSKEVCKMLGITNTTLVRYLDQFGIQRKGRGGSKKKYQLVF